LRLEDFSIPIPLSVSCSIRHDRAAEDAWYIFQHVHALKENCEW
jgi:hypothetical protein